MNINIPITVITSTYPKVVTKKFGLSEGCLTSETSGNLSEGTFKVVHVEGLEGFSKLLMSLEHNQCLVYGLPPMSSGRIMTEKAWLKAGRPQDGITRTQNHFHWNDGPGILMLDFDVAKDGSGTRSRDEILQMLTPMIGGYRLLWMPSTSSLIFNGDTELRGIRGQRFYAIINDAKDIPRAGRLLNEHLWVAGLGRFDVSTSGSLLERPIFDGQVFQPNRIDFAAGAYCEDGLEQRRGNPIVLGGSIGSFIDSRLVIKDLTNEELTTAISHKNSAKSVKSDEAKAVRAIWMANQHLKIATKCPGLTDLEIENILTKALKNAELWGDYLIKIVHLNGDIETASIMSVLDNPSRYHGALTKDPLEEDYDGGRTVGKLYLYGARPTLHSMAHGGKSYRLHRQPIEIEIVDGKDREAIDATLEIMRRSSDLFDFGDTLATVDTQSRVKPLNERGVPYHLAGITQYWAFRRRQNDYVRVLLNPPARICTQIVELGVDRRLKPLDAIINAPTLRLDGSILNTLGYDQQTRLLLDTREDLPEVSNAPTVLQARSAYESLMRPFEQFPFSAPIDRAVMLAALLTAVMRPVLPVSPAFGFDAPTQGSGKTLLARCVGVLATGEDPPIWPHISDGDAEIRKRIFSALQDGSRVLVWDNLVNCFDSPALGGALTAPTYSDRVLGRSETKKIPNRALFIFTGNNLSFSGDMVRRVLVCRIDPKTEKPYAREFDLDPFAYCLAHRQQLVAAALTLVRFYLSAGVARPGKGRTASFEVWDDFVRQTIIHLNQNVANGGLEDVLRKIDTSMGQDPIKEALGPLFDSWYKLYGNAPMRVSEILKGPDQPDLGVFDSEVDESTKTHQEIIDCIKELMPQRSQMTAQQVGMELRKHAGTIVNGFRLEDCQGLRIANSTMWKVEKI